MAMVSFHQEPKNFLNAHLPLKNRLPIAVGLKRSLGVNNMTLVCILEMFTHCATHILCTTAASRYTDS